MNRVSNCILGFQYTERKEFRNYGIVVSENGIPFFEITVYRSNRTTVYPNTVHTGILEYGILEYRQLLVYRHTSLDPVLPVFSEFSCFHW